MQAQSQRGKEARARDMGGRKESLIGFPAKDRLRLGLIM